MHQAVKFLHINRFQDAFQQFADALEQVSGDWLVSCATVLRGSSQAGISFVTMPWQSFPEAVLVCAAVVLCASCPGC